ncbi:MULTISPECIES: hypothetical protein [Roseicyclus]|jgi:hypothetical protein|uniref:hypothetical protein n=1 Tax=Roseicyclus amphidinii TaxID=3034232 RepID=UPI0032E9E257
MINIIKGGALLLGVLAVAGCVSGNSSGPRVVAIGEDRGFDSGSLSQLESGIYIDPDGCHVWMIDDGLEGYWSRRRDPVSGLPVCTNVAPPNSIVGDFRAGSNLSDLIP